MQNEIDTLALEILSMKGGKSMKKDQKMLF